ncbi:MAG: uracil-DNA glycosylase [Candidatus Thermoplasmatota archaeon]
MSVAPVDPRCRLCRLSGTRTHVVAGKGDREAPLLFIGEAPGKDEDLRGAPFVGRAGRVLDGALAAAGVSRDDVYITNLVKCRPPGNRRPKGDEVRACRAHLEAEVLEVGPEVVCLLGQTVAEQLAGTRGRMRDLVGKEVRFTLGGREMRAFVAYHPAACLYRRENVESLTETVRLCAEAAGLR